jgi:hypothetical protein
MYDEKMKQSKPITMHIILKRVTLSQAKPLTGLEVWFQQYSTCFATVKPLVQTPVTPK